MVGEGVQEDVVALDEPSYISSKGYSVDLEESFKQKSRSPIKQRYTPKLRPDEVNKRVNKFRRFLKKVTVDDLELESAASLRDVAHRRLQHMLDVSYIQDSKKAGPPRLTPLDREARLEYLKSINHSDAQSALDMDAPPSILKRQKLKPIEKGGEGERGRPIYNRGMGGEEYGDGEEERVVVPPTRDAHTASDSPRTEEWHFASVAAGGRAERDWLKKVRGADASPMLEVEPEVSKERSNLSMDVNEELDRLLEEGVDIHDLSKILGADSGRIPSRQDVLLVEFWLSQMLEAKGLLSRKQYKQLSEMKDVMPHLVPASAAQRRTSSVISVQGSGQNSVVPSVEGEEKERADGGVNGRPPSSSIRSKSKQEKGGENDGGSRPHSAQSTTSTSLVDRLGSIKLEFEPLRQQLAMESPLVSLDNSPTRFMLECFSVAIFELIRQVGIHCKERGELLLMLWNAYVQQLESYLNDAYMERINRADMTIAEHFEKVDQQTIKKEKEFARTRKDLDKQVVALKKQLSRIQTERDLLSTASQKTKVEADEVRTLLDSEIRSHKDTHDRFQKWKMQEHERRMVFEKNVAKARKQVVSELDKNRSFRREVDGIAKRLALLESKYGTAIAEFTGETSQEGQKEGEGEIQQTEVADDIVKKLSRVQQELEMEREARQQAEKEVEALRLKMRVMRTSSMLQMKANSGEGSPSPTPAEMSERERRSGRIGTPPTRTRPAIAEEEEGHDGGGTHNEKGQN